MIKYLIDKNIFQGVFSKTMNIISLLKHKSSVAYLYDDNTIRQGLEKIRFHGYTAIPVISRDGTYIGTVSEGDFLWHYISRNISDIHQNEDFFIRDIIRKDWNPPAKINIKIDELLMMAMDQNFVPMIDDRRTFIGIITRKDIIKYFYNMKNQN